MRKIVIIILVLAIGKLLAQTSKTFSGDLDNGKVTFSYYDDPTTGKEVRHGAYKYIETDNGENGSKFSLTITGVYKNGYRDGIWNYTINKIDCSSENNNEFYTGNTTMKQSYKDGMPDGIWSYLDSYKVRNQKYSRVGWSWGPFKIVEPEIITANFCNGVLCGNLLIKTTYEKVVGQLDNSGRWIGNWNINSTKELMLDKGYVMKYKTRTDDGQISTQSNFDVDMIKLIDQVKETPKLDVTEFCDKNNLTMDTISGIKHYNLECFDGNGKMFKYQKTDGDKTYIADEYGNHYDKRQYGYFILIERKK